MKKFILLFFMCFSVVFAKAQMQLCIDSVLQNEIISSGIIHSPLPLDPSRSDEANGMKKKVLYSQELTDASNFSNWSHSGYGKI